VAIEIQQLQHPLDPPLESGVEQRRVRGSQPARRAGAGQRAHVPFQLLGEQAGEVGEPGLQLLHLPGRGTLLRSVDSRCALGTQQRVGDVA